MKIADLKEQTTYVGKSGKRRFVWSIDRYTVTYDVPEGGLFSCQKSAFAQWVVREATPEERAP